MNHEQVKALYAQIDGYEAFSGSDEWDLNEAFRDGFRLALDIVLGRDSSVLTPELTSIEATCASCGDQCIVPGDEDPEDTLCAACAEDEQND